MKNSLKIFLLLLTYVLIAVCTFGVVTWMYQVPVPQIEKLDYQLYIGIAAGVLGLILGFIAAFVNTKKKSGERVVPVQQEAEVAEPETEESETPAVSEPEVEESAETANEEPAESIEEPVEEAQEPVEIPVIEEEPAVMPAVEDDYQLTEPEGTSNEEYEETNSDELFIGDQSEERGMVEPNDITQVITPIVEEPQEVLNSETPPVVIVSPLGPRNTRKIETIEEQVDDEELEEAIRETEEPTLFDMIDEVEETVEKVEQPEAVQEPEVSSEYEAMPMPEPQDLSDTQESFIHDSRVSYMNEEGKPQFVITQNIEKIDDIPEEEKKPNFQGYDVQAEKMARVSSFINKVLTAILIAALLFGIYWLYTKYFS